LALNPKPQTPHRKGEAGLDLLKEIGGNDYREVENFESIKATFETIGNTIAVRPI